MGETDCSTEPSPEPSTEPSTEPQDLAAHRVSDHAAPRDPEPGPIRSPIFLITSSQHSLVDGRVEGKGLVTSCLSLSLSLSLPLSRSPTP